MLCRGVPVVGKLPSTRINAILAHCRTIIFIPLGHSSILSSHVARLLCAGPWPLCIINWGNRAPCARFNSMALHSRLTTRQCIVVMYQLYVLHRKQPYHCTVCEAQILGAVYLVLSHGLSSREESRMMDL